MITVGVDAHKSIHVAHALDEAGHELAVWQGDNSLAGWLDFNDWLLALPGPCQVGIEGAGSYGRGLAQFLLGRDVCVYDINPRWTARERRGARRQHKSDILDARAVALIVLRDAADLPRLHADDDTAILHVLVSERDAALAETTRLRNQIHAHLLQLDPAYRRLLPTLASKRALATLLTYQAPLDSPPLLLVRADAVRALARRLQLALEQLDAFALQIEQLAMANYAPLTDICGVAPLTAGMLAAHLGPGHRFHSEARFAAYAGVAPLEASSAGKLRHRLNRGPNRQLNAIIHRIALTQYRALTSARDYVDRRKREGKTFREAIRALKRFIARAIYHHWLRCSPSPA